MSKPVVIEVQLDTSKVEAAIEALNTELDKLETRIIACLESSLGEKNEAK